MLTGVSSAFKAQSSYFLGSLFPGHNPVWVVRRAAFAVYKRRICLLPPSLANAEVLCALAVSALLLLLPARFAAQESAPLTTAINLGSADLHIQEDRRFKLSPNALQVARIIRVDSDMVRLSELTTAKNPGAGPVTSLEELSLRQRITDAVVVASLDVDSVFG
jgi:hypothetical protein